LILELGTAIVVYKSVWHSMNQQINLLSSELFIISIGIGASVILRLCHIDFDANVCIACRQF